MTEVGVGKVWMVRYVRMYAGEPTTHPPPEKRQRSGLIGASWRSRALAGGRGGG